MGSELFNETQAAAARIIAQQAKGILPQFPQAATPTQVLVVQLLLDNAIVLLPE